MGQEHTDTSAVSSRPGSDAQARRLNSWLIVWEIGDRFKIWYFKWLHMWLDNFLKVLLFISRIWNKNRFNNIYLSMIIAKLISSPVSQDLPSTLHSHIIPKFNALTFPLANISDQGTYIECHFSQESQRHPLHIFHGPHQCLGLLGAQILIVDK